MACKFNAPCPYGKSCTDCLYFAHERVRRNRKTGLDTSDMRAYKRDYARATKARQLESEMRRAGVLQ